MVQEFRGTPGLLLYLLGSENNYGLFWDGAETEDMPVEDRQSTIRAESMYKLFNEATIAMKAVDSSNPIAICNGDLLFLDLIADECKDIDILGITATTFWSFIFHLFRIFVRFKCSTFGYIKKQATFW